MTNNRAEEQLRMSNLPEKRSEELVNHIKPAPFGEQFLALLRIGEIPYLDPRILVSQHSVEEDAGLVLPIDQQIAKAYQRWQQVRRGRGEGTGFEGYFIGVESLQLAIEQVGRDILNMLARSYPGDYPRQRKFVRSLTEGIFDQEALIFWDIAFGATLGILRVNTHKDPKIEQFREKTKMMVDQLPPLRVVVSNDGRVVQQQYQLVHKPELPAVKEQNDASRIAHAIGVVGSPTVRLMMPALVRYNKWPAVSV